MKVDVILDIKFHVD